MKSSINWNFEYYKNGYPMRVTDAGGKVTGFSYEYFEPEEVIVKKLTRTNGDGKVQFDYNEAGQLTSMRDPLGRTEYSYYSSGLPEKVIRNGQEIRYTYTATGAIESVSVGDNYRIAYSYDYIGRLKTMQTPAGEFTYNYYTGNNIFERQLPNGVKTQYKFQPDGNLESITHVGNDKYIIAKFTYSYTADGLINAIKEWTTRGEYTLHYKYDMVGRLVVHTDKDGVVTEYVYDEFGNRTSMKTSSGSSTSYSYDWLGRLVTINGDSCEYDGAGNLLSRKQGEKEFGYNFSNQLSNVDEAEYQYDGNGYLVSRTADGDTSTYLNNPFTDVWQPYRSRNKNEVTYYIWDGNTPIAEVKNDEVTFLLTDHLSSVRGFVDFEGKLSRYASYSPFGKPDQKASHVKLGLGFCGLFYEDVGDVYLTKARGYDPLCGRFLQIDPYHIIITGSQKDMSIFGYCGNDPINYNDNFGTQTEDIKELKKMKAAVYLLVYDQHKNKYPNEMFPHYLKCFQWQNRVYNALNKLDIKEWDVIRCAEIDQNNNKYYKHFFVVIKNINTGKMFKIDPWPGPVFSDLIVYSRLVSGKVNEFTEFVPDNKIHRINLEQEETPYSNEEINHQLLSRYVIPFFKNTLNIIGKTYNDVGSNINKIRERTDCFFKNVISPSLLIDLNRNFNPFYTAVASADELPIAIITSTLNDAENPLKGLGSNSVISLNNNISKKDLLPFLQKDRQIVGDVRKELPWWGGDDGGGPPPSSSLPTSLTNIENRRNEAYTTSNIHMSTTGPGKRGGRGGGITRPPGWQPIPGQRIPPGRQPPLGGKPPKGGKKNRSFQNTSNIGGVYLSGAGNYLKNIGNLSGIAVDPSTGKLILISEDKNEINLPPLRLDDVVTIFRSVYQHGKAPYVSIDPDPKNPRGPIMNTRHGEATENTYVGWILFEADRVMKAFSLGEDNITKKPVSTNIDEYDEVIDAMFSSDSSEEKWERFWIVPSKVEKERSSDKDLTLFEVPLMVKTQRMVLKNGELVTAPDSIASKGAQKFAKWFTKNYDKLADEVTSVPPQNSGMELPIPVFKELKRIALITAIVEQLRDQGVPFPFWMRDYAIKPFPTPATTPSHTVSKSKGNSVLTVFGGVNLSPSDDVVFEKKSSPKATAIQEKVIAAISTKPLLTPQKVSTGSSNYIATALPGSDTKALGPCVLQETDLAVQLNGDDYLALTRKYNSFIAPANTEFGHLWSLDLPYLEKQMIPVKRQGDKTEFSSTFNLISPLNSYSEKVDKLYVGEDKKIGFKTTMVTSNTIRLHFNDDGYLVGYVQKPLTIVYKRDKQNRISGIEGYFGDVRCADISISYDNNNRIQSAKGSNGDIVKYSYAGDGTLHQIKHGKAVLEYAYGNNQVTGISLNGELQKTMHYNKQGQLLSEGNNGDVSITHQITCNESGYQVVTSQSDGNTTTAEITEYDASFRPLKQSFADGTEITADYSKPDRTVATVIHSGEPIMNVSMNYSDNTIQYNMSNEDLYLERYDENGNLLSLSHNNKPLYTQRWHPDGTFAGTTFDTWATHHEYNENGVQKRTLVTPPGNTTSWNEWQAFEYDNFGNVAAVSDNSGMKMGFDYDNNGEMKHLTMNDAEITVKNKNSLIESLETSWGLKTSYDYDADENVKSIHYSKKGTTAGIQFNGGKISEVSNYNGARFNYEYSSDKNTDDRVSRVTTPVNEIDYNYNKKGQLKSVRVNDRYHLDYEYNDGGQITKISISN